MNLQQWLQERGFVSLLEAEYRLYEELLSLEQEKKRALASNGMPDLNRIVEAEEGMVRNLAELEKERKVFLSEAASLFGLEEPALSALAEVSPSPIRERLRDLKDRWQKVLVLLHQLHQENQLLLDSAMSVVQIRIKALTLAVSTSTGYTRCGERRSEGRLFLNRRA